MRSCATLSCSADASVPLPFICQPDGSPVLICDRCACLLPKRLQLRGESSSGWSDPEIDWRMMARARSELIKLLEDSREIEPDNWLWGLADMLDRWISLPRRC